MTVFPTIHHTFAPLASSTKDRPFRRKIVSTGTSGRTTVAVAQFATGDGSRKPTCSFVT
ncbi:hypothetical protein RE6C_05760 [Rhodopirellula europaea 6C]|uniref:Uncharacterized protein n=1 Tax=Rhodopirellula europaea 6C TaxID=1263867 RepID=M2ALI0_9BACT|nr:hypothetical protein RE6C_05760 [Rhodopirellula europaea 6C]